MFLDPIENRSKGKRFVTTTKRQGTIGNERSSPIYGFFSNFKSFGQFMLLIVDGRRTVRIRFPDSSNVFTYVSGSFLFLYTCLLRLQLTRHELLSPRTISTGGE